MNTSPPSYYAAYQYVHDALVAAVADGATGIDPGTIAWFAVAAQINADSGSFMSNYVRDYTQIAGIIEGVSITDAAFQDASDYLAHTILNDILSNNGAIPESQTLINYDIANTVNRLHLQNEDYAGTVFGGLGLQGLHISAGFSESWFNTNKYILEKYSPFGSGTALAKTISIAG